MKFLIMQSQMDLPRGKKDQCFGLRKTEINCTGFDVRTPKRNSCADHELAILAEHAPGQSRDVMMLFTQPSVTTLITLVNSSCCYGYHTNPAISKMVGSTAPLESGRPFLRSMFWMMRSLQSPSGGQRAPIIFISR
jgi:hypothetical protein